MTENEYKKHAEDICQSLIARCNNSVECIEIALIVLRSAIQSCPDLAMRIDLFESCIKQLGAASAIDNLIKPGHA